MTRISEQQRFWTANNRVSSAKDQNVTALSHLASQKKFESISDAPLDVSSTIKIKEKLNELESYKKNVDYTLGFLDVSEAAVSEIHERLSRAKELSIGMANDTYDGASRKATAKEVSELINQVIQLGNSKFNGKFVFAGFRNGAPAMDGDGAFLGDDAGIYLQVGTNQFKKVNISGRDFFEADLAEREKGHFNMLDSLNLLRLGLENNDKHSIQAAIDEIDYQMGKVSSAQASLGAIWSAVEEAGKRIEVDSLQGKINLSKLQDVDIYEATSDFKRTETALQSTLLATNKLLQPSLMNFMQ